MSGLSLADMRRIGAQKNAETAQAKSGKQEGLAALVSRLPFRKGQADIAGDTPAPSGLPVSGAALGAPSPLARLPGVFGSSTAPTPASAPIQPVPATLPPSLPYLAARAAVLVDATAVDKTLRGNTLRHAGVGGAALGLVGFGATGNPLVLPAGVAVGAAAGALVGKGAKALPTDKEGVFALKRKQAEPLFAALEAACALIQLERPALTVIVDGRARVYAQAQAGSKLSSSQKYTFHLGLPLLVGLSLQQIQALAAHALVKARAELETRSVGAAAVARLDVLQSRLAKRPAALRFTAMQSLQDQGQGATQAWQLASERLAREADSMTARYAGPKALVQALLAQALVAAKFVEHKHAGVPLGEALEKLRGGYPRSELDEALRSLASVHYPTPADAMMGLPVAFLERLKNLDMSCPLPALPAHDPASGHLPEKTRKLLNKKLGGKSSPAKSPKAKPSLALRRAAVLERAETAPQAEASRQKKTPNEKPKRSVFSAFTRRKKSPHPSDLSIELSNQPLYHADEVYKGDPGTGLEAYQALVDAHPRWALARLRLAEAQIECGLADSVSNLMHCAERLPSALPTILNRLQGALAMVSPLDGENLRKVIDQLQMNADQIALERAEIDLDSLVPTAMDPEDRATLATLFSTTPGLREVWVLAMPCSHMPEVPHHAILGLAPRMPAEASHSMALSLAEHAAITGTVAVHIEAGTPSGALGDALATHASFWRANARG